MTARGASLPDLAKIMRQLLAPDGCPWDREQSLQTLRPFVIEEAFEVVDAIDSGVPDALREELGDLLLQIVFQSALAEDKGWFHLDDVVAAICEKLVRRHPHVFGDATASDAQQVLTQWELLKAKEKAGRGTLDGVPRALPGLLRALRVGEKASRFGYDWPNAQAVRAKVDEELRELDQATASGDKARMEEELGDVLFALASFARKNEIDPESAIRGTLARFSSRFSHAEKAAAAQGKTLDVLTDAERDALWDEAKKNA